MIDEFSREELLIGKENIDRLHLAKVAVFGIGGVGSFVVEGLARAGIGNFILVDDDTVDITNLNRQLHALHSTIGKYKVDLMKDRILDINPSAKVKVYREFYESNKKNNILDSSVNYIVDAIDTIKSKIELAKDAQELNIPIISSMGTGNKLDPTKFEVSDISRTSMCPLARIMRKEIKKAGIKKYKVLYSKEEPKLCKEKNIPGSISFVPSVAGLIISGEVVKDIIKIGEENGREI